MTPEAVHRRIYDLIEERGLSLYKLAEICDIPQSSMYTMMSRDTFPKLEALDNICNGLGISLSEFFVTLSDVSPNGFLSKKENTLIEIVRPMTDRQIDRVLSYAKGLSDGIEISGQGL